MIITFANGEEHSCSHLTSIQSGDEIKAFVALDDVDMAEAARIFSDPEITREMTTHNRRLSGNFELVFLQEKPYGIKAMLKGRPQ